MRGNTLAGIPRATQLRPIIPREFLRRVDAITQGISELRALGGSLWVNQEATSTFNSDGSGGLVLPGGQLGMVTNAAGGLGVGPKPTITATIDGSSTAGWSEGAGTGGVFSASGGVYTLSIADLAFSVWSFSFPTVIGTTYQVTGRIVVGTGSVFGGLRKADGPSVSPNAVDFAAGTPSPTGDISGVFVATATTTFICAQINGDGPTPRSLSFGALRVHALVAGPATALTQSANPNKPTSGNVIFPGVRGIVSTENTAMTVSASGGIAAEGLFACVVDLPSTAPEQILTEGANTNNAQIFVVGGNILFSKFNTGGGVMTPMPTGKTLVMCWYDGTTAHISLNGGAAASAGISAFIAASSRQFCGRAGDVKGVRGTVFGLVEAPLAGTAASRAAIEQTLRAISGMPL